LVGPVQLLDTGVVDVAHGTITIPLYLGHLKGSGKNVWYVLTDVDDPNVAAELGLNFSAKLTFASHSARTGNLDANGNIVFDAGTPEHRFKPRTKNVAPQGQSSDKRLTIRFIRWLGKPTPLNTVAIRV
jgi:hypothetical protein